MNAVVRKRLLLGIAILFFAASSFLVQPLVRSREQYDLTSNPVKGASPHLVLATNVFGWARGVIMDVIWLRMQSLQMEGRHFEVNQLAEWACQLSPRVPEVWDTQGWNMAYNVSCTLEYMPDRWAWVWAGIELLRNKGITNNPNAYDLYWSLAWMLYHKVGQQDDNAHFLYKERFALEMQDVLGGTGDWATLVLLEAAPKDRDAMMKDPAVKQLVEECAKYNFDLLGQFFDWYHNTANTSARTRDLLELTSVEVPAAVVKFLDPYDQPYPELSENQADNAFRRTQEVANESNPSKEDLKLEGVPDSVGPFQLVDYVVEARVPVSLENHEEIRALKKIEVYARARRLRDEYKMRPGRMLGVVRSLLNDARALYAREMAIKQAIEGNATSRMVPQNELIAVLEPFVKQHVSDLPVDWRGPYPHAMYWSQMGMEKLAEAEYKRRTLEREYGLRMAASKLPGEEGITDEAEGMFDYSRMRLIRTYYFSIQSLVQHGRIMFDTDGGFLYDAGPEHRLSTAIIPTLDGLLREQMRFNLASRIRGGTTDAYANFLERAIAESHFLRDDDMAEKYFDLLKRRFPNRTYGRNDFGAYLAWKVTDYESGMTFSAARNRMRGLVLNALVAWAQKNEDEYAYWDGRARQFCIDWYKPTGGGVGEVEKRGLVLYDEITEGVIVDMLAGIYLPGSGRAEAKESKNAADALREKFRQRLKTDPAWSAKYAAMEEKAAAKANGNAPIDKVELMSRLMRTEGYKNKSAPVTGIPGTNREQRRD